MTETLGKALTQIATSSNPLPTRAQALLEALRLDVPFDAAWLALTDPLCGRRTTLASIDLDARVVELLSGPVMAHDLGAIDSREVLPLALVGPDGRRVGFLVLLFHSDDPPSTATRNRLARLAPLIARGIDPMPSLISTARLIPGATAGTVLRRDGRTEPLPGLDEDPLLTAGSPVVTTACERLADGHVYSSFLWPRGGGHAPDGHAQVTVLAAPRDLPATLGGVVLLSPVGNLHALTPRELEVLGLIADGCSNQEIARALVVAPRTVAAHIEHLLFKLDATTRTIAAVRAEREGLYIPAAPST